MGARIFATKILHGAKFQGAGFRGGQNFHGGFPRRSKGRGGGHHQFGQISQCHFMKSMFIWHGIATAG